MATVNTRIESLNVSGSSMTAKFSSTNSQAKYEAKLDGWAKWKSVDNPATFNDLQSGQRTLYVRSLSRKGVPDPSPAVRQFVISAPTPEPEPEPEPQPEPDGELLFAPKSSQDWNARLIERFPGATITDPEPGVTRFWIPGPADMDGGRCEVQAHGSNALDSQGGEGTYEGEFWIPGGIELSQQHSKDFNTISQFHGDNNPGYTGGLAVVYGTERLVLRIMDDEHDLDLGKIERDAWNHVRMDVKWSSSSGYQSASLNGAAEVGKTGVRTSAPVSDKQMFRVGLYPRSVERTGMDLRWRNVRVYAR